MIHKIFIIHEFYFFYEKKIEELFHFYKLM